MRIISHIELMNWIMVFKRVNENIKNGIVEGTVVPLTDSEYYTEQIHNLTNEKDWDRAKQIAEMIADKMGSEES